MFGILGAHLSGLMLRDDPRLGIESALVAPPLECRRVAPVENRDFLGNVGARQTPFFGIVGADRRHSGGT